MAKRTYKKQPKPPNTKYSFEEYRELALDLYHNKGLKKNKIMAELGTPFWEGKEWFVEFSKKDPEKFTRVQAEKKLKLLETRESREIFVDEEVENWAKRLDKEGKWPKGKSLKQFEAIEKGLQTKLFKEIDRLKALGIDASDGHIVALANENIKNTPLEKVGKGGSHSPRARIPELLSENLDRGKKPQLYDLPKDVLRKAGIPTTSAEAFSQYLTGDQGTGVRLTTKDKQRIHIKGENPDKVIAQRHNYVEGKKIEAAKHYKSKNFNGIVEWKPKKLPRESFKDGLEMIGKIGNSKAGKLGLRTVAGVSLLAAGAGFTSQVKAATQDPSAANYTKLGLRGIDLGLEVVDTFTLGLSTPVTLAAQAGLFAVEDYIDNGPAKISTIGRTRR